MDHNFDRFGQNQSKAPENRALSDQKKKEEQIQKQMAVLQSVKKTLMMSVSHTPKEQESSRSDLQQLLQRPNEFFGSLCLVFQNTAENEQLRFLALVALKNSLYSTASWTVQKDYADRWVHKVAPDVRAKIRSELLKLMYSPTRSSLTKMAIMGLHAILCIEIPVGLWKNGLGSFLSHTQKNPASFPILLQLLNELFCETTVLDGVERVLSSQLARDERELLLAILAAVFQKYANQPDEHRKPLFQTTTQVFQYALRLFLHDPKKEANTMRKPVLDVVHGLMFSQDATVRQTGLVCLIPVLNAFPEYWNEIVPKMAQSTVATLNTGATIKTHSRLAVSAVEAWTHLLDDQSDHKHCDAVAAKYESVILPVLLAKLVDAMVVVSAPSAKDDDANEDDDDENTSGEEAENKIWPVSKAIGYCLETWSLFQGPQVMARCMDYFAKALGNNNSPQQQHQSAPAQQLATTAPRAPQVIMAAWLALGSSLTSGFLSDPNELAKWQPLLWQRFKEGCQHPITSVRRTVMWVVEQLAYKLSGRTLSILPMSTVLLPLLMVGLKDPDTKVLNLTCSAITQLYGNETVDEKHQPQYERPKCPWKQGLELCTSDLLKGLWFRITSPQNTPLVVQYCSQACDYIINRCTEDETPESAKFVPELLKNWTNAVINQLQTQLKVGPTTDSIKTHRATQIEMCMGLLRSLISKDCVVYDHADSKTQTTSSTTSASQSTTTTRLPHKIWALAIAVHDDKASEAGPDAMWTLGKILMAHSNMTVAAIPTDLNRIVLSGLGAITTVGGSYGLELFAAGNHLMLTLLSVLRSIQKLDMVQPLFMEYMMRLKQVAHLAKTPGDLYATGEEALNAQLHVARTVYQLALYTQKRFQSLIGPCLNEIVGPWLDNILTQADSDPNRAEFRSALMVSVGDFLYTAIQIDLATSPTMTPPNGGGVGGQSKPQTSINVSNLYGRYHPVFAKLILAFNTSRFFGPACESFLKALELAVMNLIEYPLRTNPDPGCRTLALQWHTLLSKDKSLHQFLQLEQTYAQTIRILRILTTSQSTLSTAAVLPLSTANNNNNNNAQGRSNTAAAYVNRHLPFS